MMHMLDRNASRLSRHHRRPPTDKKDRSMLADIARRLRRITIRQLGGCLAVLLLAGGLSGCLEDSPPSTAKPPAARATNTPKPAAGRPTATPKPAAGASDSK